MPAPGKPFEVFVAEESVCRQYAAMRVGLVPPQAAEQSVLSSAAAGTVFGTAAGAVLGAAAGNAGVGAAAGAGTGLLVGLAAADAGYGTAGLLQWRYDIAYQQCMYAKGNQVPGFPVLSTPPPPPPPSTVPPPR